MVVAKPMSPSSLYDRLSWIAFNPRNFVDAPTYFGPDRRFKIEGFPTGVGRRQGDKAIEVSDETGPTLAQDDIDNLFNSSRVWVRHMSNSNGAREFPVETDFQRRSAGPGGVTRNQAVGDAEAQIETLKEEFTDWLKDGLTRLQNAIQLAETYPDNAMLLEDAFRSSCELRDIGTTVGYELVTFVAKPPLRGPRTPWQRRRL